MDVARHGALLVDVADVEHGFVGQQIEVGDQLAVLLFELQFAGIAALFKQRLVLQQQFHGALGLLVAADGRLLLRLAEAVFDRLEVLELQLGVDHLLVAHGVDRAVDVGDVAVFEAAQHVDDRVRVADVAQELVAQPLALRGSLDEPRDVDDFDRGGDHALGLVDLGQTDQPLVGHGDDAYVGLDRAEREIGRLRLGVRQTVEQGRLADVRQPYDAAL